ncbi:hypothetical protein AWB67_00700 [Caballeronia terrestris]|jgi:hypothetical protein|uniref:Uncharacterized protein n=1 Tax=Caballeronia terrestris TaxID=1226301 RepID=A0A158FNN7_9BURK|nr:hypothetical protein AWB67_00700 [Caballeronia terrestris]
MIDTRRWVAEMLDDRRLVWEHDAGRWSVIVDGKRLANDRSLESAIDAAYAMTRALAALSRR